ncbi:MAG: DUF1501 domain-containing protein [Planctomycetota bacterium]|nr:DUF1501 domain-containing protein [Planctomycetota bacterium]
MLTLMDPRPDKTCQGLARREFLRVGTLGFGGLSLASLLRTQAEAALPPNVVRPKSVVLLFLQGGPSHIEFFDPKMTAPAEFHSVNGEIQTTHPGITFGSTFPQLAQLASQFSIVRSYGSKNAGHSYGSVVSGRNPLEASASSVYARVVGTNNPLTGIPTNTLILPEAIDPDLKLGSNFETGALPTLTQAGQLGKNFEAFNPIGGGELKQNMELKLTAERFGDRRQLLSGLDQIRRDIDSQGLLEFTDEYQQQAFDVIANGAASAFDLSKEDPKTIDRYDTSHFFTNEEVQKWGDMRRSSNLLGRQMLMARRLCEAGCGFVTVSDCGWDMHSNGNSPKNLGGMKWLGSQVDHAVAAFIRDVEERGLSDDILLVVTGEMGRTPRINGNGGRDHYGELTPLLLSGGGLKMGQVIGQSDRTASRPATEPFDPSHLFATIMHTLFDVGELRLVQSVPRDILQIINRDEPITGLL